MKKITSIGYRNIYNSHLQATNEFVIRLDDGSTGYGGSSQGETISIYEDKNTISQPQMIISTMEEDQIIGRELTQESYDAYLEGQIARFGRNNVYALSEAFYNTQNSCRSNLDLFQRTAEDISSPRICFNILNGGWHAYTNPVLSDFHEYILVAKSNDIYEMVELHNQIQRVVREKLLAQPKTTVAGNMVNHFKTRDNRECLDFLLQVCHETGAMESFEIMVDASGTDLWNGNGYKLEITDQSVYSKEQFLHYWLDLIQNYQLRFLEDPFFELDKTNWQELTEGQTQCMIIGDNFYSSNAERIREGAQNRYTHGVIIKPNQAGTVSAVRQAIAEAKNGGQRVITSHRSVSTESTFLSTLSCLDGADYIKIGPLLTDYSSIIRLNEIIRIAQKGENQHGYRYDNQHDEARSYRL